MGWDVKLVHEDPKFVEPIPGTRLTVTRGYGSLGVRIYGPCGHSHPLSWKELRALGKWIDAKLNPPKDAVDERG